jgi:hypothetical protein
VQARREAAAAELVRAREVRAALHDLAEEGISPVLLKGTALAYSVYSHPSSRPRADTDLMIGRDQVTAVRRIMARRGYDSPPFCDGELLFCQFPQRRVDTFGIVHAFDFHWKISTQTLFADMVTFDELQADAIPLPALGPHARAAGVMHALLLACVHPVMHHRHVEDPLWLYDVHLLASQLDAASLDAFVSLARWKGVAAICGVQLRAAHERFATPVDEAALEALGACRLEPTVAYLRPNRDYRHELLTNVTALPRWRDRARLLREIVLPDPSYMLASYAIPPSRFAAAVLPCLYLHRIVSGGLRTLKGDK